MKPYCLLLVFAVLLSCETQQVDQVADFQTHFELSNGNETATYLQTIDFYIRLAREVPEINIQTIGETDSGLPLHIVTYNADGDFNYQKVGENKVIVLINNGIHPGESDGVDATMLLFRDLAIKKVSPPEQTILVTIPMYNVGGALNRNSSTRVNQNGPKSYGFRGNTKNYDLNRDFIKSDSKNAKTFAQIYHLIQPDIFVDNHVSNGADYQYTLTHLFTQHNKLGGAIGDFLHSKMMPQLEQDLVSENWEITPYVNVFNRPPENGFSQFMDHPRYSTGYTALWNTLGLMVETHMLKPYEQRVEGTYTLLTKILEISEKNASEIKKLRTDSWQRHKSWTHYPVAWKVDSSKVTRLNFKGYKADTITSLVTGFPRLRYDRSQPFTKEVVYMNYYHPADSVSIPRGYILKKGWDKIVELLELNNIEFTRLDKDTLLNVESYKIDHYQTTSSPYEGHYLHYNTSVLKSTKELGFKQGDILILTDQPGIRYLLETLEPQAVDSFFNWNFFDPILQRKEGFSPYVFEDLAAAILEKDEGLREAFDLKRETDEEFAQSWYAQLSWVYERSEFYEAAHLQYPVFRIPAQ
ncbi:MAG: M14 family metallopeptidase [Flavobacteriaceae bacterium]